MIVVAPRNQWFQTMRKYTCPQEKLNNGFRPDRHPGSPPRYTPPKVHGVAGAEFT